MIKEIQSFEDFHAGHSLHEIMQEEGHDMAWLAQHTGRDIMFLQALLEQPNMDAELFVRLDMLLQPLFMQRVEEAMFGKRSKSELQRHRGKKQQKYGTIALKIELR